MPLEVNVSGDGICGNGRLCVAVITTDCCFDLEVVEVKSPGLWPLATYGRLSLFPPVALPFVAVVGEVAADASSRTCDVADVEVGTGWGGVGLECPSPICRALGREEERTAPTTKFSWLTEADKVDAADRLIAGM